MALAALVLLSGFVPAGATTVVDPTPTVTDTTDTSASTENAGGDQDCLSEENASDPLATPFCLMGIDVPQDDATANSEEPEAESAEPAACKVPLESDKCPTWSGTYDEGHWTRNQGYWEKVTDQALSPTGDRLYISTVDRYSQSFGGGGGRGASVVAIDPGSGRQLWAANYDDPQSDRAAPSALVVSPDGNQLYVTGMSFGTVESGWDFVTMAFDAANGERLWISRYGGAEDKSRDGAISAALSDDGRTLYVTGSSGIAKVSGAGTDKRWDYNYDYATVAYRADSGEQLWVSRYNAENGNDQPMSVGLDAENSRVFVTGFSSLSGEITSLFSQRFGARDSNSYDYSTVAYDAVTGAQVWESRYGNAADRDVPRSLQVAKTPDGTGTRIYVTGSTKPETGPSQFATVAYDPLTGEQKWASSYTGESSSANDPSALAVSSDGRRVYVTGTTTKLVRETSGPWCLGPCFADREVGDYATVAHDAITGQQVWARSYDHYDDDRASAIAVSPDNGRVYVTGASDGRGDDDELLGLDHRVEATTVAYDAHGGQSWVGRYRQSTNNLDRGIAVSVSPDSQRVVVSTHQQTHQQASINYGVLAYEADGPGPLIPRKAEPPPDDAEERAAQGSFSLMSIAHAIESSAGPAAPWDGTSEGPLFRYNSSSCSDEDGVAFSWVPPGTVSPSATVNNISTNLTSYNTLIPGENSPGATRTHPLQFRATAPDAQGKSRLSGTITIVACSLIDQDYDGARLDTPPDSELPRITFDFEGTADKAAAQEARFEGTFEIKEGTGVYKDITGSGRIHGYLFCFVEGYTAGGCAEGEPFRDAHYTMTGWYHDPTVPGARKVFFPPIKPVDVTPPAPEAPGIVAGPFSLQHMIHTGTWDGTSGADGNFQVPYQESGAFTNAPNGGVARPGPDGTYPYGTMPCWANAPVNNVSTNLTTYNSRLPGGAAPASARNQPFKFAVSNGDHPRQRKINGTISLDVCHRKGGPIDDGKPDIEREKINFEVTATAERVSGEEVRFDGTFKIVGGTGVYRDLTGYGRIHGYLFCFRPSLTGSKGGWCHDLGYRDGQYTMNGWYSDPTVAELGVGPTKLALAGDSPRSGQYSDQVTPKATLQDADGKPIADTGVDFELAGAGGTRAWTATTDAQGVAAEAVTLDLTPGAYDLSVRYAGSEKRGPSSDKVAFTISKEATATALLVEGQAPKRTLRARVADDDAQRLAGVAVQFSAGGKPIGAATTDANGEATLVVPARYQGGSHRFRATFAGDDRYLGSSGEAQT